MGGKTSIFDRIQQGFQILKLVQNQFEEQEIKRLQAMLYAFACKFLKEEDLAKIKEEIGMTVLGQMLVNEGENLLAQLMNKLLADNRVEDAMLATNDEQARKRFYKEYGLVGAGRA